MIYNSNGNNTPYQSGGNAKVQKELKALQEAINLVDANFNNYVDENDEDIVRIDNNIDAIELSVSDIGTRLSTAEGKIEGYDTLVETDKVQAQDADFHNVVAGKYVFQNGAAITGTNICKIADGSVVYATDGTNAILIDYTNKDAWVAKAKTELNQKFRIYSNGVLTFTQSGGWNVYVLGNDFSTDDFTVPGETPIEVVTGVTIGGTLYAALARDYAFDNITVTSATINSATVNVLTASSATITDLTVTNETVADLTVNNEGNINDLVNAKRNIQDEVNGKISVDSHPTNVQVYIGVHKFTGTYNLKLTHMVHGAVQTLFTASIVWNGNYPIVQYYEYADNEPVDYLYSIVLTDDALYFVTQGAGNLYYSYDAFGGALAPTTSEYPNIPYQPSDVIAEYVTEYHDRTVFFGGQTSYSGVDILGELNADVIHLPEDFSITDLSLDGNLTVNGTTTLNGNTTADNITVEDITLTGDINAGGSTGTEGQVLTIKEGHPAWEDSGGTSTYTNLATDNLTVKQKMVAGGTGQFSYARAYKGREEDILGIFSWSNIPVLDAENHVYYMEEEQEGVTMGIYIHVGLTNDTMNCETVVTAPASMFTSWELGNYYSVQLSPSIRAENPSEPILGSMCQEAYCYPNNRNIVDFWKNYTNGGLIALPSYDLIVSQLYERPAPNDAWWVYNPSTDAWTPYTVSDFQNLGVNVTAPSINHKNTFASFEVDKDVTYNFEYVSATNKEYEVITYPEQNRCIYTRGFVKEEELTPTDIKALVSNELVYFDEFDSINDLPDLNTLHDSWASNTYAFVGNTLYTYLPNISEPGWQEMPGILGPIGEEYNILTPFVSFTVPAITNVPDYDYSIALNGTVKLDDFNVIDSNNKLGNVGETLTKTENGIEWKKAEAESFNETFNAYTDYSDMTAETTNIKFYISGRKYGDVVTIKKVRVESVASENIALTNNSLYLKKSDVAELLELGNMKINFTVKSDISGSINQNLSLIGGFYVGEKYTLILTGIDTIRAGEQYYVEDSGVPSPLVTYVGDPLHNS